MGGQLTSSVGDLDGACLSVLPPDQVIGVTTTAISGFVSAIAVVVLLLLVARNYIRNIINPPPGKWKLIRTHVDAYLLSLMASELLQGLGAILNVKWSAERKVYCSDYCTAQGAIQQIGETGVAMATLAIAVHTFMVIFFRWIPSYRARWIYRTVIAFIWLYLLLFVAIGLAIHNDDTTEDGDPIDLFYAPTPYWCWIGGGFDAERIAGEYFWLWFAAFGSILLYALLFFRVRGNIQIDPENWRRIRFRRRSQQPKAEDMFSAFPDPGKSAAREALSMIWYPISYCILVLPLSIVRWSTFRPPGKSEPHTPAAVTFVVIFIFGLSGVVNVVLIMLTRKNLLLFGGSRGVIQRGAGPAAPGAKRLESGGGGNGNDPETTDGRSHRGDTSWGASGVTGVTGNTVLSGSGEQQEMDTIPRSDRGIETGVDFLDMKDSVWEKSHVEEGPYIEQDLSIPMKFNPTPAPSPPTTTIEVKKSSSRFSLRSNRSKQSEASELVVPFPAPPLVPPPRGQLPIARPIRPWTAPQRSSSNILPIPSTSTLSSTSASKSPSPQPPAPAPARTGPSRPSTAPSRPIGQGRPSIPELPAPTSPFDDRPFKLPLKPPTGSPPPPPAPINNSNKPWSRAQGSSSGDGSVHVGEAL